MARLTKQERNRIYTKALFITDTHLNNNSYDNLCGILSIVLNGNIPGYFLVPRSNRLDPKRVLPEFMLFDPNEAGSLIIGPLWFPDDMKTRSIVLELCILMSLEKSPNI